MFNLKSLITMKSKLIAILIVGLMAFAFTTPKEKFETVAKDPISALQKLGEAEKDFYVTGVVHVDEETGVKYSIAQYALEDRPGFAGYRFIYNEDGTIVESNEVEVLTAFFGCGQYLADGCVYVKTEQGKACNILHTYWCAGIPFPVRCCND